VRLALSYSAISRLYRAANTTWDVRAQILHDLPLSTTLVSALSRAANWVQSTIQEMVIISSDRKKVRRAKMKADVSSLAQLFGYRVGTAKETEHCKTKEGFISKFSRFLAIFNQTVATCLPCGIDEYLYS